MFSIYKIVDNEYSTENYKSSKSSFGTVMKNPEMLKFFPDHLKSKKVCTHLKKLPFMIRYVPDDYKTQEVCDKPILENDGILESVPDCCKIQKCVIKLLIITFMH